MAAPVQQPQQQQHAEVPLAVQPQPAPQGVAAARDGISSAAQPAAPAAPGYFERAVKSVVNFFQEIYNAVAKLFGCGKEKANPEILKLEAILRRLEGNQSRPAQLISDFKRLFSEEERVAVYRQLGRGMNLPDGRWFANYRAAPNPENLGMIKAEAQPDLLIPDLIAKVQELLEDLRADQAAK